MRDLAEINHLNYIWKNKLYYDIKAYHKLNKNDYYYSVLSEIVYTKHHSSMGKFPWTYIDFGEEQNISGWKIHISATLDNHIEVLKKVSKFAFENEISFKFASNLNNYVHINSKNINRVSSGKYIVMYPKQKDFDDIIEKLYVMLKEYDGPYILSDKCYKDSKILFYRYGEINPITFRDNYGTLATKIIDNKNDLVTDERLPYYKVPDWISDKKYDAISNNEDSILLKKYLIKSCLHFSAQGGVYKGERNGFVYIIKEARKNSVLDNIYISAVQRTSSEYEILLELKNQKCTPNPIEKIEEFGNVYLVQEYVKGVTLRSYPHSKSPYFNPIKNEKQMQVNLINYYNEVLEIAAILFENLDKIHSIGIVLRDISPGNIIFDADSRELRFIDLETACKIDSNTETDYFVGLFTPGFNYSRNDHSIYEIEFYKVALVLMYCIAPYNSLYELCEEKILEFLSICYDKTDVPVELLNLIYKLIKFKYKNTKDVLKDLKCKNKIENKIFTNKIKKSINYDLLCKSILNNIQLFTDGKSPLASDPQSINTNEYSFGYGMFGMVYSISYYEKLLKCEGSGQYNFIVTKFMADFYKRPTLFSNGLYIGLSGIAYVLLKLGFRKEAKIVLERVNLERPHNIYDFAYGLSGNLIVNLIFYKESDDILYLKFAEEYAKKIITSAIKKDGMLVWKDSEGDCYSGFTRGCSGIAYSLLLLYFQTKDKETLSLAVSALESDLSRLLVNENGFLSINSKPIGVKPPVYSPYIHNGIAGIGCVLIRFYKITKLPKYLNLITEMIEACRATFILYPGYLRGCTGIISFLQDCKLILGMKNLDSHINYLLDLLNFHYVEIDNLTGFPGDELYKISNDLFTGSSGILLQSFRECAKLQNNPFIPGDELLFCDGSLNTNT